MWWVMPSEGLGVAVAELSVTWEQLPSVTGQRLLAAHTVLLGCPRDGGRLAVGGGQTLE